MRRSRSRRSASMSASHTGELAPLVQFLIGDPNLLSASAPASATACSSRSARWPRGISASVTGNGEPLHPDGRRVGRVAELKIVGRRERAEHIEQVTGDGDLAHRICALAMLDPKTGGAAAVVAGHQIDSDADEIGDIETL